MALYQNTTFATTNQLVTDIKNFLSTNGWTIDLDTTYGSYNRIHIHKGGNHFEIYGTSTAAITMYACTGYNSGSAPNAQPGVSYQKNFGYLATGSLVCLVSCGNSAYFGATYNGPTGTWMWAMIGTVETKFGAWNGGQLAVGIAGTTCFGTNIGNSSGGCGQVWIEGAWSHTPSTSLVVNGIYALWSSAVSLTSKGPNDFNAAIVPFPIVLFRINASTTSFYHPLGYLPGIYNVRAGDLYSIGDIIVTGADQYLLMPANAAGLNQGNGYDFLFKLSA